MELTQYQFEVTTHPENGTVSINQPSDNIAFGSDMVVINFDQINELISLLEQAKNAIGTAKPAIKSNLSLVK